MNLERDTKIIALYNSGIGSTTIARRFDMHPASVIKLLRDNDVPIRDTRRFRRDLTGQTFGRLTAIRSTGQYKNGEYFWLCRCGCGKEKTIRMVSLVTGDARSCGCGRRGPRQKAAA